MKYIFILFILVCQFLFYDNSLLHIVFSVIISLFLFTIIKSSNWTGPYFIFNLIWFVSYNIPSLYLYFNDIYLYGVNEDIFKKTLVVSNISHIVICFTWLMFIKIRIKQLNYSLFNVVNIERHLKTLWIISLVSRIIISVYFFKPGNELSELNFSVSRNLLYIFSGALSTLPFYYYASLCCKESRNLNYKKIIFFAVVEILYALLFTGSKFLAVQVIITMVILYELMCNRLPKKIVFSLVIIISFTLPLLYAYKSFERVATLSGNSNADIIYNYSFDDAENIINSINFVEQIVLRLDQVSTTAAVINFVDTNGYITEDYLLLWLKPYIPRFIWEDKGWVGLSIFISESILLITDFTHAVVNSTIEGYLFFGFIGIIFLSFIHGATTSILYSCLVLSQPQNSLLRAFFGANFFQIIYFNQSFVFYKSLFILIFIQFSILFLILLFFNILKHNTISKP